VTRLALLLLLAACTREPRQAESCKAPEDSCRPAVAAKSLQGAKVDDDGLRGKVVLVNFWATWCAPCAKELPAIQRVYERHKDRGLVVLGLISADPATDDEIVKFASGYGLSFPVVRASEQQETAFGLGSVLPTTFLYDRAGRLRRHWDGAIKEDALEDEVKVLLQ